MNAGGIENGPARLLIWSLAAALAVLAHLSLAWILTRSPPRPEINSPPAMLLDLEPPKLEAPPPPPPPAPAPIKPPQTPPPPKPPTAAARPTPAPAPAPAPAPRQGQTPAPNPRIGVTVESWQGMLTDRLERAKRFPVESQAQQLRATPKVLVTIDRAGRVRSAEIQLSSGSAALDDEALAIVQRADPLPPPPADVDGDLIEFSVFVRFALCDPSASPAAVRCF